MLEYKVCGGYAALPGNKAAEFDDLCLSFGDDIPEGRAILYRIDDTGFREAKIRGGNAVFDRDFVVPGGEYTLRVIDGSGDELRGSPFTVCEHGGSLIAVRRREALMFEVGEIWNAMIRLVGNVRENAEICRAASDRVTRLIDGYRTE